MAFRITYDEILELIKKTLLRTDVARAIVRRAGARPGDFTGASTGRAVLPPGGLPWMALTKLSDEDFDVGWRFAGYGPGFLQDVDNGWVTPNGPPCNTRILTWTRLRDSRLRSGVSNNDRFGFSIDPYWPKTRNDGVVVVDEWYERNRNWAFFGDYAELFDRTVMSWRFLGGDNRIPIWSVGTNDPFPLDHMDEAAKDECRLVMYVTRAEWPYTVHLSVGVQTFPQEAGTLNTHYHFNRSTTGRFVTDWLPFSPAAPISGGGQVPQTDGTNAVSGGRVRAYVRVAPTAALGDNTGAEVVPTQPATYPELQLGDGPLCIPFCEVEMRTTYTPSATYWVQDQYTPDQYRNIAKWEELGYGPEGPEG